MITARVKVGDALPDAVVFESLGAEKSAASQGTCPTRGPASVSMASVCPEGSKVVLFGVPGAFTATCSARHLPGFRDAAQTLAAKHGITAVVCVAVNDAYVMNVWGVDQAVYPHVRMLGDGEANFAKALGLDFSPPGMGLRVRRFSMYVENGVIRLINVEQPGQFGVSSAEAMLEQLSQLEAKI